MKLYPWLQQHFTRIISNYQSGNGHHSLLIRSVAGMGDEILIYEIARFLMCHQPKKNQICGKCHSCHLMQAGTHPDYYRLSPESERSKNMLGVDKIREVNERLHEHARLNGAKVVWINDADFLTESAANALLKILEEPPRRTWFFLSCRELMSIPLTLLSRCRQHYLNTPQEALSLLWLKYNTTTSREKALTALRLNGGAPITALEFLNPEIYSTRERLCIFLKKIIKSRDWLSLLSILNHDQVLDNLHWLISLFLDSLKTQHGIILINNIDNRMLIRTIAHTFPSKTLQFILHEIFKCRKQLITISGIDRELLLMNNLLRIENHLCR